MKKMPLHAPLYHILVVCEEVKEQSVVVSTKAEKIVAVVADII
jgi:hypothetical protein